MKKKTSLLVDLIRDSEVSDMTDLIEQTYNFLKSIGCTNISVYAEMPTDCRMLESSEGDL